MGHADDLWGPVGLVLQGALVVLDVAAETLALDPSFRNRDGGDVVFWHRFFPLSVILVAELELMLLPHWPVTGRRASRHPQDHHCFAKASPTGSPKGRLNRRLLHRPSQGSRLFRASGRGCRTGR